MIPARKTCVPLSPSILHIAEKQVTPLHNAQISDNRLETLRIHPVRRDDADIKTDKFKNGYLRCHAVVYGTAPHIGDTSRRTRYALEGLGHRNGVQRRKPHADHEGNGNDGPADAGKPGLKPAKPPSRNRASRCTFMGQVVTLKQDF